MAAAAILDFQVMLIWPFRRVDSVAFVKLCSVPNWVKISVIVTEIDVGLLILKNVYLMTSRELSSVFAFGHVVISA